MFVKDRRRNLLLQVAAVLTITFCSHALADLKVMEGEYIVTPPRKNGIQVQEVTAPDFEGMPNSSLAKNVFLLKPEGSKNAGAVGTLSLPRVVKYDKRKDLCAKLIKRGKVGTCAPNYVVSVNTAPNDPKYSELYAHQKINSEAAWNITTGRDDVIAAVIDTGIDYTHPDLAENIWTNSGEIAGDGIDNDGNGYIDDVHGYDFRNEDGDPMDDNGHGTHVAGTIAGRGNNGIGVTGISWKAKLIAAKFLGADGSGSLASAIKAIHYLVDLKNRGVNIRVINNSWGGGGFVQSLKSAIEETNAVDMIFAAAAGNESNNNDSNPSYPAGYDVANVVSVASTDRDDNASSFSNYGAQSVDIAAPGSAIVSTYPGNKYATLSGTSMATPHVTGALVLYMANNSGASAQTAITALLSSGDPLSTLNGIVRTQSRLNVGRLLQGGSIDPALPPPPTPVPCTYSFQSIDYSPNLSADSQAIQIQADEDYERFNLPFNFPYFGKNISEIHVSTNGVIYTSGAPGEIDFQPGLSAPASAIAALHTDLLANADPYGVRVALKDDSATLYWKMNHYKLQSSIVQIRTTLYSSGIIENFVDFSDQEIQSLVRSSAVIGVSDPGGRENYTYANSGSELITSGLAIRMIPSCSPEDVGGAKVKSLKVKSVSGGRITPGSKIAMTGKGAGTGEVTVAASIDGVQCLTSKSLNMKEGKLNLRFTIPKSVRKSVDVTIGGISKKLRLSAQSKARASSKKPNYSSLCSNLMAKIR